jgi:hypothetical protein
MRATNGHAAGGLGPGPPWTFPSTMVLIVGLAVLVCSSSQARK